MYHSITFGKTAPTSIVTAPFFTMEDSMNTWDDWHLIPSSRPAVASPGVSTNFVEIPGRNGPLDLTTFLTGEIVYGQRSGSWEFYVDNDHEYWDAIRTSIVKYLHGQERFFILEDVPTYYCYGRFAVDIWKSDPNFSKVTINYALDPYMKSIYAPSDDWLWDPFNFETDYTDSRKSEGRL